MTEETVLVAEDEDSLRMLYSEWLSSQGYDVIKAENGEEALQLWDEDINIVLLDRRMPEKYGDEVLNEARDDGLHTPVTMLTAVDPDLDLVELPFDDYMIKPVDRDQLLATVEDLLNKSEIRDVIREFVRVGIKINKLQQAHEESMLQTHAEYQSLKSDYVDLREEVTGMVDDLDQYERQLLRKAQKNI